MSINYSIHIFEVIFNGVIAAVIFSSLSWQVRLSWAHFVACSGALRKFAFGLGMGLNGSCNCYHYSSGLQA